MILKKILPVIVLFLSACGDTDKVEVYNSSNTFVKSGIVYNIDERPINGVYKVYYSNGNVKMDVESKDGKPHGVGKIYAENGNLQFEGEFYQGLMHGEIINYYQNGKIFNKMNYNHGKRHGLLQSFDENGNKLYEIDYNNGKAVRGKSFSNGIEKVLSFEELKELNIE